MDFLYWFAFPYASVAICANAFGALSTAPAKRKAIEGRMNSPGVWEMSEARKTSGQTVCNRNSPITVIPRTEPFNSRC